MRVSEEELMEDVCGEGVRLVLFGEEHGSAACHELERRVFQRMSEAKPCILSLEMLSTDQQDATDAYLARQNAAELANPNWENWEDYVPLVSRARRTGSVVVAANAPRRFTSLVAKEGYEGLAEYAKDDRALIAPLPYKGPSTALRKKLGHIFWRRCVSLEENEERETRMLWAQSLWDATMAHNILTAMHRHPDRPCFHVCGRYHIEHFLGIVEQLEHYSENMNSDEGGGVAGGDGGGGERGKHQYPETFGEREHFRTVVFITSPDLAVMDDTGVAADSYLRHAGDFVVVCSPPDDVPWTGVVKEHDGDSKDTARDVPPSANTWTAASTSSTPAAAGISNNNGEPKLSLACAPSSDLALTQ